MRNRKLTGLLSVSLLVFTAVILPAAERATTQTSTSSALREVVDHDNGHLSLLLTEAEMKDSIEHLKSL